MPNNEEHVLISRNEQKGDGWILNEETWRCLTLMLAYALESSVPVLTAD